MSSLLTQSLKRLAEMQPRQEDDSRGKEPAGRELHVASGGSLREATPQSDGATSDDFAGVRHERPEKSVTTPRTDAAARPQPQNVPRHLAELCTAIFSDVGQPATGDEGKVVVLVSVQADKDTKAAAKALSTAMVSLCQGDILSMDAAGPAAAKTKESAARLHGFTSLIDGTRAVEDVIVQAVTPGVAIIPPGSTRGLIRPSIRRPSSGRWRTVAADLR
jgi:hypothetical protein